MSVSIRSSQLTLYKDCKITPDKRFFVDSIADYLQTLSLSSITISSFQYLRIALEMEIKLYKEESFTAMLVANNYNYLKVVQDSRTYYFFIVKKTQLAEETISLSLVMDSINTFRWDSDFSVSKRTKVLREHKDRFVKYDKPSELQWDYPITYGKIPNSDQYHGRIELKTNTYDYDTEFVQKLQSGKARIIINTPYDLTAGDEVNYNDLQINEDVSTINFSLDEDTENLVVSIIITSSANIKNHDITIEFEIGYYEYTQEIRKKIDLYSEGLTPVLYKDLSKEKELEEKVSVKWHLAYKTSQELDPDSNIPVEAFLIPDSDLTIKTLQGNVITPSNIESGYYYVIARSAEQDSVIVRWNNKSSTTAAWYAGVNEQYWGFAIRIDPNDNTRLEIVGITWKYDMLLEIWKQRVVSGAEYANSIEVSNSNSDLAVKACKTATVDDYGFFYYSERYLNYSFDKTLQSVSVKGIETLNKSDSKLIKVFSLPYFPLNYDLDSNGNIILSDNLEFDASSGFIKVINLNLKFLQSITTEETAPSNVIMESISTSTPDTEISLRTARSRKDPKLYHSDYYQPKFVYDSFSFTYQLEKMNQSIEYPELFKFDFVMTTTIRSRFLFKFPDYILVYPTEDYPNILPIARNNEEVIYNSEYLTYLRTGFNIDIKAKERKETASIVGGVLGGVGAIAGGIISAVSGNIPLAVSGVLAGATALTTTIINTANTIAQSEASMESKLRTLRAQAVSVQDADDIDLLESYSNNKAKLTLYKISPRMEQALDDLFYYTGYISNEIKKPVINTRFWFNFLSCELVFEGGTTSNIPEAMKEDLVKKYQEGVIFLHKHIVGPTGSSPWNFELDLENWESALTNFL